MVSSRRESTAHHLVAFGQRVRDLREAAGLSQEALAYKAGLQPAALSQIESGQRDPQISALWMLAEALQIPPASMIEDPKS
jgi:transcriptional regulator with XRE-family HTH domain